LPQNYDSTFQSRIGTLTTLTAQIQAPSGATYTIQSGTFTLTDQTGTQVVAPTSLSGFQNTPLPNPQGYFLLDTTALQPGVYAGVFLIVAAWSINDEVQTLGYAVEVTLLPAFVGAPATYDGGATPLGLTRLYAGDSDINSAVFSDSELSNLLLQAGNVPTLAASLALEAAASDNGKLAYLVHIGEYQKDATKLAAELRAQAQELRNISAVSPIVKSPNQEFIPAYGTCPGNMGPGRW
jgi:hypothetical protein